ncbi:hypothetical protein ES703_120509 [subsurface metagenome]
MRDDIVGLDCSILMHPLVWKASGHTDQFADLIAECKKCNVRTRVDHLQEKVTWHGLPARENTAKPVPSEVERMAVPQNTNSNLFQHADCFHSRHCRVGTGVAHFRPGPFDGLFECLAGQDTKYSGYG